MQKQSNEIDERRKQENPMKEKLNKKEKLHSCPKLKLQPVFSFSSFVHNSSINEHKNMKLRENICYEMIYCFLYYWGFGSNL